MPSIRAIFIRAQEMEIHERLKHRAARRGVQPTETLGLRRGQPQAGHLKVFGTNAFDQLLRSV
jgi:hypothetical protein